MTTLNRADKKPLVFISYAKEDIVRVRSIQRALQARGVRTWFDELDLRAGPWRAQISKAIARSRFFLIFLSQAALQKTGDRPGFQDQELNEAYQIAMNQSPQSFTIVPVRIEDCGRGDNRLMTFSQYDLFQGPQREDRLDSLALELSGIALRDKETRTQTSEDERFLRRLLSRAEVSVYANEPDKALEVLETILRLDKDLAAAHHLRGCILEADGRDKEALEAYTEAIMRDPQYAVAYNNRGFLRMSMGDFKMSRADYDKSIELEPTEPIVFMNRATGRAAQGLVEEALEDMSRAIALDPHRPLLYKTKAEITHHMAGNPADAVTDFDTAIRLAPNYRDAYFKRGVAREDSGDLKGAVDDYSRALAIEETPVAFANRAGVYHQLGANDLAVSDLESALRIDPNDEVSKQALASIQAMIGVGQFFSQFPELSRMFTKDTRLRTGIANDEGNED
jgi:tetratricopeptide (TPR) repeat protein